LAQRAPTRFPAHKATNVNTDTHLVLTFSSPPAVGSSGKVLIFNAADNKLVDTLDLSIPPGPGVAAGGQPLTTSTFSSLGGAAGARGDPTGTQGAGGQPRGAAPEIRGGPPATTSAAGARGPVATYTPTPYTYDSPIHATNANTVPGTPSGAGDSILGRGATFWEDCEVRSNGVYMWIRNTAASHGNVFLNCKFETPNGGSASLARAPINGGRAYPNAEVVLINCALAGISPEGFGPLGGDTSQMHLWEYNSTNVSDGKPVDVSRRLAASKQLDKVKHAQTIANYSNPAFVLGFTPTMAPAILSQLGAVKAAAGQPATFTAKAATKPPRLMASSSP
jgi:hypothetical protein